MNILERGTVPANLASAEQFTGEVWQIPLFRPTEPSCVSVLHVNFSAGARTFWHTYPVGQILYILSGSGLVCVWGSAPRTVGPGDTVQIPPNEKHWHGTDEEVSIVHLAIQERSDGVFAHWMEEVRDDDIDNVRVDFSQSDLRAAFGLFMTGVTVTTMDEAGVPRGFTADSFASVSFDPPLPLVSISRKSHSFDIFTKAKTFTVNIFAHDQSEISNAFARSTFEKFDDVRWSGLSNPARPSSRVLQRPIPTSVLKDIMFSRPLSLLGIG